MKFSEYLKKSFGEKNPKKPIQIIYDPEYEIAITKENISTVIRKMQSIGRGTASGGSGGNGATGYTGIPFPDGTDKMRYEEPKENTIIHAEPNAEDELSQIYIRGYIHGEMGSYSLREFLLNKNAIPVVQFFIQKMLKKAGIEYGEGQVITLPDDKAVLKMVALLESIGVTIAKIKPLNSLDN